MNVGILAPGSKAHPDLMQEFMSGIRSCLKKEQIDGDIQLFSEYIGFGGREKEVYERAEKLLLADGVDVLVAYLDLRVLPLLQPLLFSTGKLLLVVNAGANEPENWVAQPNVMYLTLLHGFLCWKNGLLAAQKDVREAILASTFYDCGYFHTAALVSGFTDKGGEICFNYISNQSNNHELDIGPLRTFFHDNPQVADLLCVFDSLPASLFYQQINQFQTGRQLRIFASPMMLEKQALCHLRELCFSIEGYLPWLPAGDFSSNADFIHWYRKNAQQEPTVFSLQGWETGLLLQQIFLRNEWLRTENPVKAIFGNIGFPGPRGILSMDQETHHFTASIVHFSFQPGKETPVYQSLSFPQEEWKRYIGRRREGVSSGWTNTYLCY